MKGVPMAPLVPGVATSRFSPPSFPPSLAPSAAVDESGGRRTGAEGFRNARRLRRAAAAVGKGRSWGVCALARRAEGGGQSVGAPAGAFCCVNVTVSLQFRLRGGWVYQHPAHGSVRPRPASYDFAGLSPRLPALSDMGGPRGSGSV
jgi:hypothetical protein